MTEVTALQIRGKEIVVHVNESGRFIAEVGGKQLTDETLEGLRKKLMTATKAAQAKIALPFTLVEGPVIEPALATGLHAGSGAILIQRKDGTREQLNSWGHKELAVLTAGDLMRARQLLDAAITAQARWDAFEKEHKINLRERVQQEIDKLG